MRRVATRVMWSFQGALLVAAMGGAGCGGSSPATPSGGGGAGGRDAAAGGGGNDAAAGGGNDAAAGGAGNDAAVDTGGNDAADTASDVGGATDSGAAGADAGPVVDATLLPATTGDGGVLTTRVGAAGGAVRGPSGIVLVIPAGALAADVDVAIARDSTGAPAFPAVDSDVGVAGAAVMLTPHGTTFATPATIYVPVDLTLVPPDGVPALYKAEPNGAFAALPTTVQGATLSASVSSFSWVIPAYPTARPRAVYAVTASGIASYRVTTSAALAAATSTAKTGAEPAAVGVHPSGRFAYATNGGTVAQNGVDPYSVASYRLDPINGAITGPTGSAVVNTSVYRGRPVAPTVHPSGKFLYVSGSSDVSVFAIDGATGTLTGPVSTADSGGAVSSAVVFTPAGNFALVAYRWIVGTPTGNTFHSQVKAYAVDPATGLFTGPIGSAAAGDNPWAMVMDPLGKHAYIAALGDEVRLYDVNATTGAVTFSSSTAVLSKPGALAIDTRGRFLYVGKQQPFYNVNLLAFRIDATSGALTAAGTALAGSGAPGQIAVVAEPQGDLVYVGTDGQLSAFKVAAATGGLTASGMVAGFTGAPLAGVGVPVAMGASGVSPLWRSGCTTGCIMSGGSGGGGSDAGAGPVASGGFLSVTTGAWGGLVRSTPAGIDCGDPLQGHLCEREFTPGSGVQLCVTPRSDQVYDITWSGGCSGTTSCINVSMTSDRACHVELQPHI